MRTLTIALLCLIAVPVLAQTSTRAENPLVDALIQGDVYVAPELAGVVDKAQLKQVAQQLRPFTVKFVVVPLRDRQSRNKLAYALRNTRTSRKGQWSFWCPRLPGCTAVSLSAAM